MKSENLLRKKSYAQRIQWRVRVLWLTLILMNIYMFFVVELGGGDSRIMTDMARMVSRVVFFGGIIFLVSRIIQNKKVLKNRRFLKEQQCMEQDERNRYLHDKSGGIVVDFLIVVLLFSTFTAALFDMAAFYAVFIILVLTVLAKAAAYWFYSHVQEK